MEWLQKAWNPRNGKPWKWEGARKDGRAFRVFHFAHLGYIARTFNGANIGIGLTLAQAQKLAETYMSNIK